MNPAPSLSGALWNGNQQLATKRQLISSISGLYADIQDINLSTVVVNNVTASTGTVLSLGVSTLSFKGFDSLLDLDFSFDLGLGDALGGLFAGLGGIIGGTAIGLGTGVGLTVQSISDGLFSLANTRQDTYINSNVFETVNGTTQLQISTLGNAFPLYSSIFRTVSSVSADTVPGQEIFTSTFFLPGTTCIRSISDPVTPLTKDSNTNTSSIQSFGQWIPFLDPTVVGEDIFARNARFSTLQLINSNTTSNPIFINTSNTGGAQQILSLIDTDQTPINSSLPYTDLNYANSQVETPFQHRTNFLRPVTFVSTAYTQYTSTIGTYNLPVYFLTSTITNQSTIPKFTYVGTDFGGGNFAVCEPDETSFLSTYTLDLVAQSSNVLLQWGLAINNRNSTIAQGTAKRISWDNTANTSNFIDIPVPQSTTVSYALGGLEYEQHPYEARWLGQYTYSGNLPLNPNGAMAFGMKQMAFGATSALSNQPGYPYHFHGSVFVDGVLEADTLIAISSIINVSTNLQTFFSTQVFDADEATISSLVASNAFITNGSISSLVASNATISTLVSPNLIEANEISTFGVNAYTLLSQFSYVSTLVVDFQILEGFQAPVTTRLNNILGDPGSRINMTRGTFGSLSTINASTVNFYASNALIPTLTTTTLFTSDVESSTGTFSTITTSTLNVNTISTTSHTGSDITCDNITINDFATFPSVANGSNIISMTFSNTTNSNAYVPLVATLIQGSVFPQTSNTFSISLSGSNTTIEDDQALVFNTLTGDTVTFGSGVEQIVVTQGDFKVRGIQYGSLSAGFLQPRAFAQSNQTGLGTGTNATVYVQVTDGTNTFAVSDYNFMPCMMGFNVLNTAVAVNEAIIRPFQSNSEWWVRLDIYINAGAAGADVIWYWNNLLFPYNMMT